MTEPDTPPSVFISYAHADSEFVTRLITDLEAQEIHTWIDKTDIKPGTPSWEEALRKAIREAHAVLLIASSHSRSSRYVNDELRIAEMYQRKVYPIWVVGTQWIDAIPIGWGGTQYIDARAGRYQIALSEIVTTLRTSTVPLMPPKAPDLDLDFEPRNPYKGLQAFTSQDSGDFFGRDTLINELANALEEFLVAEQKKEQYTRLLAVVGPSGSGKSSVVMAGLIPCLLKGGVLDSEDWVYLDPIVPGEHPVESLTRTLWEKLSDKSLKAIREDLEDDSVDGLHLLASLLTKQQRTKVVLFVDQFEELFTQIVSEEERRRFIDLLITAITEPGGPVIVILTLRADFYDRPMQYPKLGKLIQEHHKPVLLMETKDLRAAIEKPAALPDVQLTFEGDLVGDLLFEVRGESGALPLLEFTLDQLFQRRSGHHLTLRAYHEIGGIEGALAKHAESTYSALRTEEHRTLARVLFLRLIDPGATEQDTTRRRAALSELLLPDPAQTALLRETADAFIAARLLTTTTIAGVPIVEVSHETLIREWPRLTDWVRADRNDILLQQAINEDAAEWKRRGKPTDRLYRDSQLVEAQAWAERNRPSMDEADFLQASIVERERRENEERKRVERELELQRRAVRRQRYVIGMAGVTAVVIILALVVALLLQNQLLASLPVSVTTLNDQGQGSLRYAIDQAKSGDAITFASNLEGTIVLSHGELLINKNITISGPGASRLAISGRNVSRVFHITKGFFVTISKLTIENGRTNGFQVEEGGAGIDNDGSLVLTNCTIVDNTTGYHAGSNDSAYGWGGGIFNLGTLQLVGSNVSRNSAYDGGGIENFGTLIVDISTISQNIAAQGGGISVFLGQAAISRSTISNNTAYGGGGGLASGSSKGGTFFLTTSTISGNKASRGGGISDQGGDSITESTISGNSSSEAGGGLYGGYQDDIIYSTIYNNRVKNGAGGGINVSLNISLWWSIVAGNSAKGGPDILGNASMIGPNLIQNTSGLTPVLEADNPSIISKPPDLGPLQNNGGPTQTNALLPGSPAVDQIPNGPLCGPPAHPTDQRGITRPQGKGCDLGAYEYVPST